MFRKLLDQKLGLATPVVLRDVVRGSGEFLLSFAHGGLLIAGVMVLVILGYQYSAHGVAGLDPRGWLPSPVVADAADEEDVVAVVTSSSSDSGSTSQNAEFAKLPADYQRLTHYIAKRFKVSALAVEQLVRTALHEGKAMQVDPTLVLAVSSVESSFNPLAESVFGAQGLMQIIPRFHQDKIDQSLGRTALLEPAENIRVGTRILRDYMRAHGALEPALQQYGGVSNTADMTYPTKVITELNRFRQVMKYGSVRSEVAVELTPPASRTNTRRAAPAAAPSSESEQPG